jgi:hypothetical protein
LLISNLVDKKVPDDFGIIDSLMVLKNQITSRINQLQKLINESKDTSNKLISSNKNNNTTTTTTTPTKTDNEISLKLSNSIISDIQLSLLKNLNLRINEIPDNIKNKNLKIPLINKLEINKNEHELQILNFNNSNDLKLRNHYLNNLNMLYYSELLLYQETIKDIILIIKNMETNIENKNIENGNWIKINQINDNSVYNIINDLQIKISNLEIDKLHMENEIVNLKERLNNLMENQYDK